MINLTDMMTNNTCQTKMGTKMPCKTAKTVTNRILGLSWLILFVLPSIVFAAGPPAVSITDPAPAATISSVPHTVTGTCTDTGLPVTSLTFDDGSGPVAVSLASLPNWS